MLRFKQQRFDLRLRMVQWALREGLKATAEAFGASRNTVRTWVRRYQLHGIAGLADHSRAPPRIPHKTPPAIEEPVVALRQARPTWGAKRLKRDFELSCSHEAIRRIYREHDLIRPRKTKARTKHDLRAVKAQWSVFQQLSADTKALTDLPHYWPQMRRLRLPQGQYTARDVRSGLTFLGFSAELSLTAATLFANRIMAALQQAGLEPTTLTWQTDNGSEFIGAWNAKAPSAFTGTIEGVWQATHRRIPPGAKTYQSDVETFHRLIEDEFFDLESFATVTEFKQKITTYQWFFNVARKNGSKGDRTPLEILQVAAPHLDPRIAWMPPLFLDDLMREQSLTSSPQGGQNVPWHPTVRANVSE